MKRILWLLILIFGCGAGARAKVPGAADPYRREATDPAVIRLWGNPAMERLFQRWEEGYRRQHPEIRFEHRLISTAMAMPGIYLGLADLALLGRELDVEDHDGFAHVRAYEPFRLEVATGSMATPGKSPALVAFVHASNPLRRISLRQLDGAFGEERLRGGKRLAVWGDFGLGGEWARRPIHLYLPDLDSGTGQFFLRAVLKGSRKLNWDRLVEVSSQRELLARLRTDPAGLALASLAGADARVRPLDLGVADDGPFYPPTRENLISRRYPLTRAALVFVNRVPGRPIESKVGAFLSYLLSPEGQALAADEGGFLPLGAATLAAQSLSLAP